MMLLAVKTVKRDWCVSIRLLLVSMVSSGSLLCNSLLCIIIIIIIIIITIIIIIIIIIIRLRVSVGLFRSNVSTSLVIVH